MPTTDPTCTRAVQLHLSFDYDRPHSTEAEPQQNISLANVAYGVTGPVMTGLGPSLRRLPSGDPKPTPGGSAGVADGKPDGGSDAGDSLDGQLSGGLPES